MDNLAQIETIKQKIRTASTAATTALHKLIFEEEGDRRNRQRIRDFQGFTFQKNTTEYAEKLEFGRGLTIGDLISCCNILGLEYNGSKEEIIARIVNGLMNLNTLAPTCDEDDGEEEDDENEEEDETSEEMNDEEDDN
ncbi:PREDICTED: protein DEK-like, partial [Wasmannia auropunctata]|uniref:protein DEK-like n=1 Tax=Wasmannia auropunctata TaxID=64793 RepID=UPI0005F0A144